MFRSFVKILFVRIPKSFNVVKKSLNFCSSLLIKWSCSQERPSPYLTAFYTFLYTLRTSHQSKRILTHLWPFPIISKPVNWFAFEINWLVSIWWGTLVVNGLKMLAVFTFCARVFHETFCRLTLLINFIRFTQKGLTELAFQISGTLKLIQRTL